MGDREDADAVFDRAVATGATELMSVEDSGDGDRRGGVTDPFGHVWYIAPRTSGTSPARTCKSVHDGAARP